MRTISQSRRFPLPKMYPVRIPDGDAGVTRTISHMKALVHSPYGAKHWLVRQAALEAARGTERGLDEVDAVNRWIKEHIEFRGEYGETLQDPMNTLRFGAGDCDDQSMLAAAMLESLGFQTRFKTIALQDSPEDLSHVYVEVREKRTGQWISVDPTVERSWPGWEPEGIARGYHYGPNSPSDAVMEGVAAVVATLGAALILV